MFFVVSLAACGSSSEQQEESNNEPQSTHTETAAAPAAPTIDSAQHKQIEAYVKKNNLKGEFTPEGIFYSIENAGSGENPTAENTVKASYKGYLLNGSVFDDSKGNPIEFQLNRVVKGWKIGIPKFKKGGSGKLIIPSEMGYGEQSPSPELPANSILVFDIKLVDFK